MADGTDISFQWNESRSVIIRNKGFGKDLNRDIGKILASHMDKYVPYDSNRASGNHLANSVRITPRENSVSITYVKPYANYQYHGSYTWNRDLSVHNLATSYWDKMCWSNESVAIMNEINAARKRHAK